ncbi:Uncharacterised protein [Mycobacteroides abscessus subsp. abscessus]|nr:Uncharacterised protein [Mycobacteroides abscessus subsp. abscessus]
MSTRLLSSGISPTGTLPTSASSTRPLGGLGTKCGNTIPVTVVSVAIPALVARAAAAAWLLACSAAR